MSEDRGNLLDYCDNPRCGRLFRHTSSEQRLCPECAQMSEDLSGWVEEQERQSEGWWAKQVDSEAKI